MADARVRRPGIDGDAPGACAVVAGACGFIGRALVRRLQSEGLHVVGLDLPDHGPGDRYLKVDLTDRDQVVASLAGLRPRWVFNTAGFIDHSVDWPRQREVTRQHLDATFHLVEALWASPPEAFVNIGSSDEYGDQPAPQHEDMREMPIAPYSAAKVAAAHYLQMLHRRVGFPATVARFFLVYGPGQDAGRLIPQACKALLRGETLPASPGDQVRDFLYIDDAIDGLIAVAGAPAARGLVLNVASGEPRTVRSVLAELREVIGRGSIDFGARPKREGEPPALVADTRRVRSVTSWCPAHTLTEGLRRTAVAFGLGAR
jgi:nucleoside-diphosphate-sugar epimerase